MQRRTKCSFSVATAAAMIFATGSVANAAESSAERLDSLLESTPGAARVVDNFGTVDANFTASSSVLEGSSLEINHPDGTWMKISLPDNAVYTPDADSYLGDDSLVTTQQLSPEEAAEGDPSSLDAIAARAVVAIPNAEAPSSYDFNLELPEGVSPELQADGSVKFILDNTGGGDSSGVTAEATFGEIKRPWAVDAAGNAVATSFTLKGNTLTQTVDFDKDTKFPVMADPEAEWKGFYGRLTYSAAETANMRDQGVVIAGLLGGSAGIAALFGPGAPIVGAALAAGSAAAVGIISATAANAHGDGRCLEIDIPPLVTPAIVDCRS